MTDRNMLDRFDSALAEAYRETVRSCGGEIWEANGVVSWASPLPQASPAYANGVMRVSRVMSPREALGITARFFAARKHGYTLLARSDDRGLWAEVERNGKAMAAELSAMVTSAPPPRTALPEEVELRPVENPTGMLDFCGVVASSLGPETETRPLVDRILRRVQALTGPHRSAVVAYEDGSAAACALATLVDGTALIGWVCTKPEYRGRGLATSVVDATVRSGFEDGADLAAVLSPPALVPVLDSLGFEEISRYREYVLP
ncbi:MAG: GNAT family N-acetyltransferase [bacterium]|nr:GNAT family N-acetyltransferase [bacterium]